MANQCDWEKLFEKISKRCCKLDGIRVRGALYHVQHNVPLSAIGSKVAMTPIAPLKSEMHSWRRV
jgi:hypothetical protein